MLRSYIMLSHSDIVLRTVFRANKISLRLEGVISLSQSENITLCTAKNITYLSFLLQKGFGYRPKKKHLYLQMRCWFYPISIRKASMNFIEALIILMRSTLLRGFSNFYFIKFKMSLITSSLQVSLSISCRLFS